MSHLHIYKSSLFTAVRVRVDLRTPPGAVTTGVGAVIPVGVTTTYAGDVALVGVTNTDTGVGILSTLVSASFIGPDSSTSHISGRSTRSSTIGYIFLTLSMCRLIMRLSLASETVTTPSLSYMTVGVHFGPVLFVSLHKYRIVNVDASCL